MAYVFICSPTSGTASMLRIFQALGGPKLQIVMANGPASLEKAEGVTYLDRSAKNALYCFRGPQFWNNSIALDEFRVIGHFRDPRDLCCNQFWWAQQHPNTRDTPEVAEAKRRKVADGGINKYALGRNNIDTYKMLTGLSEGPAGDAVTWTSYTQLCCAFDYMIDNLCKAFNKSAAQVATLVRNERPESLFNNPEWVKVGGTWKGADVTPGRFRTDLDAATAQAITEKYAAELRFCRERDADFLAHHYR